MSRRIFSLILILFMFLCLPRTDVSYADDVSRAMVEQIISGNQDYLVLANIIEKGASAYEVQIFEEIGNQKQTVSEEAEAPSDAEKETHIFVEGFEKYMYYDDYNYRPQKGDNVLLSLKFNGNSYTIQNGAYRVNSTSHEQFSFMMPDSFKGSEEALELNALYIYVNSNGEIKDLSIKDGAIYGKDANGAEEMMKLEGGIEFLDEFGDTSEKPSAVEMYTQPETGEQTSKWQWVLVIVVAGALLGFVYVKLLKKFEKRFD